MHWQGRNSGKPGHWITTTNATPLLLWMHSPTLRVAPVFSTTLRLIHWNYDSDAHVFVKIRKGTLLHNLDVCESYRRPFCTHLYTIYWAVLLQRKDSLYSQKWGMRIQIGGFIHDLFLWTLTQIGEPDDSIIRHRNMYALINIFPTNNRTGRTRLRLLSTHLFWRRTETYLSRVGALPIVKD